jgi:hypothetical protein
VNNRLVALEVDESGADTAPVHAPAESVVAPVEAAVAPVEVSPVEAAPHITETIENAPVPEEIKQVEAEVKAVAPVEVAVEKVTETIENASAPTEIKEVAAEKVKQTTESHLVKSVSDATVTETPADKSTKKKGGLGRKVHFSHVAYQNLAKDRQLIPF